MHASHNNKLHDFTLEIVTAAFLVFSFSFFIQQGINTDIRFWQSFGYWRNYMVTELTIFGIQHQVTFRKQTNDSFTFRVDDEPFKFLKGKATGERIEFCLEGKNHVAFISSNCELYYITISGVTFTIHRPDPCQYITKKERIPMIEEMHDHVLTPLTGKIIKINIKMHEKVNKGDVIMVVESMKMENYILAPRNGQVTKINVSVGDRVIGQDVLAIIA
jgi:biotin carboxyl carrier protein